MSLSTQHPLVLIFLGPPGAGKGTQAQLLSNHLKIPHISTGNLLREHVQTHSELGKKAQGFMEQGHLVPDLLIIEMLLQRVAQNDCMKGYILDGFPRTVAQAEAFQESLQKTQNLVVINLNLSDESILERLSNRFVCKNCATPYHLIYSPSKEAMICDLCGAPLIQRNDDKQEVVINRLKVYHAQTAPLIAYYTKLGILHTITCENSKEQIFKEVLQRLDLSSTDSSDFLI